MERILKKLWFWFDVPIIAVLCLAPVVTIAWLREHAHRDVIRQSIIGGRSDVEQYREMFGDEFDELMRERAKREKLARTARGDGVLRPLPNIGDK